MLSSSKHNGQNNLFESQFFHLYSQNQNIGQSLEIMKQSFPGGLGEKAGIIQAEYDTTKNLYHSFKEFLPGLNQSFLNAINHFEGDANKLKSGLEQEYKSKLFLQNMLFSGIKKFDYTCFYTVFLFMCSLLLLLLFYYMLLPLYAASYHRIYADFQRICAFFALFNIIMASTLAYLRLILKTGLNTKLFSYRIITSFKKLKYAVTAHQFFTLLKVHSLDGKDTPGKLKELLNLYKQDRPKKLFGLIPYSALGIFGPNASKILLKNLSLQNAYQDDELFQLLGRSPYLDNNDIQTILVSIKSNTLKEEVDRLLLKTELSLPVEVEKMFNIISLIILAISGSFIGYLVIHIYALLFVFVGGTTS